MKKTLATIALAFTAVFGLAACSSPEPVELGQKTVIVDVRTSAEYAAGHLEGAINVDVQSPDFDSLVAELPADGEYVVYCASGNRSASAVDRMADLGLTDLTDAGGISEAAESTGLEIVTGQ